jgi:hypothetical protein
MAQYLTTGCMLSCTMGTVPMPFLTLPLPGKTMHMGALPGGIMTDIIPIVNIPSFVMCRAPLNPTVIAATAAAMGVPTPGACLPMPVSPWVPPSVNETYAGLPKTTLVGKCVCAFGGIISPMLPVDMTRMGTP